MKEKRKEKKEKKNKQRGNGALHNSGCSAAIQRTRRATCAAFVANIPASCNERVQRNLGGVHSTAFNRNLFLPHRTRGARPPKARRARGTDAERTKSGDAENEQSRTAQADRRRRKRESFPVPPSHSQTSRPPSVKGPRPPSSDSLPLPPPLSPSKKRTFRSPSGPSKLLARFCAPHPPAPLLPGSPRARHGAAPSAPSALDAPAEFFAFTPFASRAVSSFHVASQPGVGIAACCRRRSL